jgi:acetoacetyl-CoA synthetase
MAGMVGDRSATPLWRPSPQWLQRAEMTRFMRYAGERAGRTFADYEELWEWSVSDLEMFWAAIWDYCGVRSSRSYERVLDRSPETPAVGRHPRCGQHEMPGTHWFAGARLNYAENLLSGRRSSDLRPLGDQMRSPHRPASHRDMNAIAVLHASELRELDSLTWCELTAQVAGVAAGLRALGVTRGDRVVAYMPNIPETLVAFLASASIGAIWSSAAPEFGARSVIDRFAQIEPAVLLAVDGYRHGGRDYDRSEQVCAIAAELPSLRHTVVLPYLSVSGEASSAGLSGGMVWGELIERGKDADASEIEFEQVPFDHPLWVLYSSGTTGLPKAIVQGHGGILVEQLKKSLLHLDLRAGDRMFWFTTTGWMMWNFLVGCLLSDAAIVLYDGSPGHPDMGVLWELAERSEMTFMSVSAGYLAACERAGIEPARDYELGSLRAIGSTGSPLSPESYRWVYGHVGRDVWLFSTSGGTDVCTAFVGGCPLLPVYEGELQARALGCAVESWDEQGNSLVDEVGELVIAEPMPSMPLYFWGEDPPERDGSGGERYRESYFTMYPGVWRHGDWIKITPRGGAVIYGRSDSTINRQGVRMGTSEIYRAASAVPEVVDALVVDVPGAGRGGGAQDAPPGAEDAAVASGDELQMILFVVLAEGAVLDDELRGRIAGRIREDCSPRHVPNEIVRVAAVPRTLSGKVLEVPVKRILMGVPAEQAASAGSLADPHALDFFVELARERASPAGSPGPE